MVLRFELETLLPTIDAFPVKSQILDMTIVFLIHPFIKEFANIRILSGIGNSVFKYFQNLFYWVVLYGKL